MLMGIPKDIALEEKEQQLVVLTNENHTEGAATMFYAGVLNDLATKLNHSLYIIPSSTDECIAVCDSLNLNHEHFKICFTKLIILLWYIDRKSFLIICIIMIKMLAF